MRRSSTNCLQKKLTITMQLKQITLELSKISEEQFVQRFGGLYEHSPWVAESVWADIEPTQSIDLEALSIRMRDVVDSATDDQKMTLLRAHPELAGKAAIQGALTAESTDEQSRARLDQCSKEEFDTFQRLNSAYNDKFGFPFIMAVRNSSREEILQSFELRVNNPPDLEFDTALKQVHQIALLRLQAASASEANS